MFGQWHTVVVSHWCLANGIQLLSHTDVWPMAYSCCWQ